MSTPDTLAKRAIEQMRRARGISNRQRRDAALDVAAALQTANTSAAAVIIAAPRMTDATEFMRLARKHAANLIQLPVLGDEWGDDRPDVA